MYEDLINIYPSVLVKHGETQTTISLEWYEQNKEDVALISFALILLYKNGTKKEVYFDSYDKMMEHLTKLYNDLKK
ncbi:hypothetical protein [Nitratiruptor tergarcus]|uniref:Uncharacterized protein n=1 Tax=Nitratiruptor tergarcus DSM 16512 TaxID=1069081 RepID=A0A1W1WTX0_9BACT|nr:hypothetical protein [Nitratiruptor tergarcus]SMC09652.1 hypothetical protein SAMN05660197_1473 [Nitratiruptor tergarcus DSM 16512]